MLDAAFEVFLQHGFEGATLEQVAEHAGVSRQTVYAHFRGEEEGVKETLFRAMVAEFVAQRVAVGVAQRLAVDVAQRESKRLAEREPERKPERKPEFPPERVAVDLAQRVAVAIVNATYDAACAVAELCPRPDAAAFPPIAAVESDSPLRASSPAAVKASRIALKSPDVDAVPRCRP